MKPLTATLLSVLSLSFLSLTLSSSPPPSTTVIGVTYTTTPLSPPFDKISKSLSSLHLTALRLTNPDPGLIRSFAFSNASLLLSIPNSFLPPLASNRSLASRWLYAHVLPFYPRSRISLISVGDDAVGELSPFLLPAIRNVRLSLRDLGIKRIAVTTTFSFVNIVSTAFPPSSAIFQEPLCELVIKPLLQFLENTNSSFLVNVYPYNLYRLNSEIPLGFALFQEHAFNYRDDLVTGVRYRNLFDMMVDSVITALAVAGYESLPVVVAETGWPSEGESPGEADATPAYAEVYVKGLVEHLRSGVGTPLRKEGVAGAYIYELMDREVKSGSRKWGILDANMSLKYKVDFAGNGEVIEAGLVSLVICLMIFWFVTCFGDLS